MLLTNNVNFILFTLLIFVGISILYLYRLYRAEIKATIPLEEEKRDLLKIQKELLAQRSNLEFSEQKLKEINNTKDKFFSIISHDLKSPLHTIIGFIKILNDHIEAFSLEELKNFAYTMNKSVGYLLSLLENMLLWSRSQSGIIEFFPVDVNVRDLLNESVPLIQGHADSKGIKLDVQIPDDFIVQADINMLNTIIRNLLTNAVKFTKKGGVVSIKSFSGNNYNAIVVTDTGVGMSKDRIKHLFDLKARQSEKGTAQEKGNGLGLLLCQEFAERNGGSITVESKPGEGSSFTLYLPK